MWGASHWPCARWGASSLKVRTPDSSISTVTGYQKYKDVFLQIWQNKHFLLSNRINNCEFVCLLVRNKMRRCVFIDKEKLFIS